MSFSLSQRIKKLMKIGVVIDSNDSTSYPIIFASYLGKPRARATNFTPFGLWSRPLKGMMSILFNINGSESNKFALTNELKNRPVKNLKEGESVLGNLLSFVHFKEDGSVVFTITTGKTLTINGNVIMNGDLAINGNVIIDGDLAINGDLAVDGGANIDGTLVVDGGANISGDLVMVDSDIVVDGDLAIDGNVFVDGNLTVDGTIIN